MWHELFVQMLESSYEKMRAKNSKFSRRAYARKLGISNGMLSDVFNDKARFTKKRAIEILEKIEATPKEKTRILALLDHSTDIPSEFHDVDSFVVMTDLSYRSILFAFDIEKFVVTPQLISETLSLPLEEVEMKIAKLLRLGLLKVNAEGVLLRTENWEPPFQEVKEFNQMLQGVSLEVARKAFTHIPLEKRHFSTITLKGSSEQLDKVHQEIDRFYQRISEIMDESPSDEIYQMSIFLHPIFTAGLI